MESCEARNLLLKLLLFDRCKLGDLPKQTDPKREAAVKRCFSKKVLQIGVLQYNSFVSVVKILEFILSKAAGTQPPTLPKVAFLQGYFSRILTSFSIAIQYSYFEEHLLAHSNP